MDFLTNIIYQHNVLKTPWPLPDESVHMIVTSPPYWGLRDYGVKGQLGLEPTPQQFINRMVKVFREAKRVLRKDGTLWLNMGDSYAGSWKGIGDKNINNKQSKGCKEGKITRPTTIPGLKPKDLVGIPWRLALALQADGWYLRSDIIWSKKNCMPESVKDRPTSSHEYLFLLTKSRKYYYDAEAIKEPIKDSSLIRLGQDIENQKGSNRVPGKTNGPMKAVIGNKTWNKDLGGGGTGFKGHSGYFDADGNLMGGGKANKRTVWEVATQPFKEAHFATFPESLIRPCILAGTSENGCCPECGAPWSRIVNKNSISKTHSWQPGCNCGITHTVRPVVLDIFMGSGTTAKVSLANDRSFIGLELNPKYIGISSKRLAECYTLYNPPAYVLNKIYK